MTNVYKAKPEEIQAAATKIQAYRAQINEPFRRNYGYLEGSVENSSLVIDNNLMSGSTSIVQAQNEIHIFEAIEVTGNNGGTWLRITDSEYRMLNNLANRLGGVRNNSYPNIFGELKIVSENPYCKSCAGVIQQFNNMFPNIKLILVDGVK